MVCPDFAVALHRVGLKPIVGRVWAERGKAPRATAKSKLTLHLISHQSGAAANLHHSSAYT